MRLPSPLTAVTVPLLIVILPVAAHAYVPPLAFDELSRRSTHVITGEVVEVTSYRAPFQDAGEVIFSDVKIRIASVIKGTPREDEVTIQVLGGRIGTAFQVCTESARYEKGEKVLVFLREWNGRLWNTGWLQGKYTLAPDGITVKGKEHHPIDRDMPLESVRARIGSLSPSGASLRTGSAGTAPAPVAKPSERGGSR